MADCGSDSMATGQEEEEGPSGQEEDSSRGWVESQLNVVGQRLEEVQSNWSALGQAFADQMAKLKHEFEFREKEFMATITAVRDAKMAALTSYKDKLEAMKERDTDVEGDKSAENPLPALQGGVSCGFLPDFSIPTLSTVSLFTAVVEEVKVGGCVKVNVVGGVSPEGRFWARLLPGENQVEDIILQNISNSLQQHVQKSTLSLESPRPGMFCAACYSQDQRWYRGRVVTAPRNDVVSVFFIDYGNTEEFRVSDLAPLPDSYLVFPPQMIRCSFTPDPVSFSREAKWKFTDLTHSVNLTAHLLQDCPTPIEEGGRSFVVRLIDESPGQPFDIGVTVMALASVSQNGQGSIRCRDVRYKNQPLPPNARQTVSSKGQESQSTPSQPPTQSKDDESPTQSQDTTPSQTPTQSAETPSKSTPSLENPASTPTQLELPSTETPTQLEQKPVDTPSNTPTQSADSTCEHTTASNENAAVANLEAAIDPPTDNGPSPKTTPPNGQTESEGSGQIPESEAVECADQSAVTERSKVDNKDQSAVTERSKVDSEDQSAGTERLKVNSEDQSSTTERSKVDSEGVVTRESAKPVKPLVIQDAPSDSSDQGPVLNGDLKDCLSERHPDILKGARLTVCVSTDLSKDGSFWVYMDMSADHEVMVERLQEVMATQEAFSPVFFAPGDTCSAQFSEDGGWYRARITRIDEEFTVRYLDYGNTETRPLPLLAPLSQEFRTLPPLAFQCTLADQEGQTFTQSELDKFREVMTDSPVDVVVLDVRDDTVQVQLLVTVGNETIDVNEYINDTIVAQTFSRSRDEGLPVPPLSIMEASSMVTSWADQMDELASPVGDGLTLAGADGERFKSPSPIPQGQRSREPSGPHTGSDLAKPITILKRPQERSSPHSSPGSGRLRATPTSTRESRSASPQSVKSASSTSSRRGDGSARGGDRGSRGDGFSRERDSRGEGFSRERDSRGEGFSRERESGSRGEGFSRERDSRGEGFSRERDSGSRGEGFSREDGFSRERDSSGSRGEGFSRERESGSRGEGFSRERDSRGEGFSRERESGSRGEGFSREDGFSRERESGSRGEGFSRERESGSRGEGFSQKKDGVGRGGEMSRMRASPKINLPYFRNSILFSLGMGRGTPGLVSREKRLTAPPIIGRSSPIGQVGVASSQSQPSVRTTPPPANRSPSPWGGRGAEQFEDPVRLFVKNVPTSKSKEALLSMFSQYGTVHHMEKDTQRSNVLYVTMSAQGAENVIKALYGKPLDRHSNPLVIQTTTRKPNR